MRWPWLLFFLLAGGLAVALLVIWWKVPGTPTPDPSQACRNPVLGQCPIGAVNSVGAPRPMLLPALAASLLVAGGGAVWWLQQRRKREENGPPS